MKNLIIISSFLILIPFSFGDTDRKGCHSTGNENSENKQNEEKKNSEKENIKNDKNASGGTSGIFYCYPYTNIE